MGRKRKRTYEPAPEPPPEMADRYQTVLEVLSGKTTVSAAAEHLGMARNHFQTILHRGLAGLMEAITPKPPGRPPTPPREVALETQVDKLERENAQLRQRVETVDRLFTVATDLLKGRVLPASRSPRSQTPSRPRSEGSDDPEEDPANRILDGVRQMTALGLSMDLALALAGVSAATMRRWTARHEAGQPLRGVPGPARQSPPELVLAARVEDRVRDLRGLVGADALRHSVPGVSRRQAAAIKRETLTAMERERKAAAAHVVVAAPGVMRGFDALHAQTDEGRWYVLASADAAVPHRTSLEIVEHYDGQAVVAAVERDFRENGAPLVWRSDRARSHMVPEVREVLRAHGVLELHGPPHHPGYYGQLERQNREHRAWIRQLGLLSPESLVRECERMRCALNALWCRRTLGWKTAEVAWRERPVLAVDRSELRADVMERAGRLRRHLAVRGEPADLIERLAIEQALTQRGLLRLQAGVGC